MTGLVVKDTATYWSLRAISHDLRTPITSISGNASTLITGGSTLEEGARQQIYADIYSESMWLIGMVENLLYATPHDEAIKPNI